MVLLPLYQMALLCHGIALDTGHREQGITSTGASTVGRKAGPQFLKTF